MASEMVPFDMVSSWIVPLGQARQSALIGSLLSRDEFPVSPEVHLRLLRLVLHLQYRNWKGNHKNSNKTAKTPD